MFDVPWSGGNEILLATLAEVEFPNRLVTSMKNEGVVLVGQFVQLTEFSILRRPGLGRRSLNEAKEQLNGFGLHLGMNLHGWDDDLAEEAREAFGRELRKRIFELSSNDWQACDSLENELMAFLLEVEDERNAEMLSHLFGFDGSGTKTLESVGRPYELTRERVRQIAARAERKLKSIWRPLKKLDAAKRLLLSGIRRPFTQVEFGDAIENAGISKTNFHIDGLLKALELVGERHSFCDIQVGKVKLYGKDKEVVLPKKMIQALRRETAANGCTNIQRLALLIGLEIDDAPKVRELLSLFSEVHWLDSEMTWLLSTRPTRSRLANVAGRIFSVAQSVEINELRAALLRPTRVTFVPPVNVLAKFLVFHGIAKVYDHVAIVDPLFEAAELGKNDLGLALAFEELGSPVAREQLEDYCLDDLGMNTSSFYVHLSYSPLVIKLATGVFSRIGLDVDPGAIEQMKAENKASQFEATDGWSKAGTLWWHFQADRPTIHSGTHTIPTFVLKFASGEWNVKTVDGFELGAANVKNGFISGFKLVFSILGVSNNDYIQVDFDIASRTVFVRIVGNEPDEFSPYLEGDEFDQEVALEEDD